MVAVALAEAKARLSELVRLASAGETVTITSRGKPVVDLIARRADKSVNAFDLEEMRRLAALSKPYVDPEGLSFVERMRREDIL